MAVNASKVRDSRSWRRWYESGAVKQHQPDPALGPLVIDAITHQSAGPAEGFDVLTLGRVNVGDGYVPICWIALRASPRNRLGVVLRKIPANAVPVEALFGKSTSNGSTDRVVEPVIETEGQIWTLVGYDSFDYSYYPLRGEFRSLESAQWAAELRLLELERTQPTSQSGGQGGIQDYVYIVHPDGTRRRYLPLTS